PNGYEALSNGVLVEERRQASGMTRVYEQDEPMATYLATVHIGRYVRRKLKSPVESYALVPRSLVLRLSTAFGEQGAMLELFVERFGPYPFSSYGVVVTEDELEIPLESQGLSTFGSNHL